MNQQPSILFLAIGAVLATALVALGATLSHPAQQPTQPLGSASDNTTLQTAQATSVWIGKDIDSTLVATNTSRAYLAIWNLSGATGTAQTLYCNTNGRPGSLYSGLVIHASTSPFIFDLDHMYRGALHCLFPTASGTAAIVEW